MSTCRSFTLFQAVCTGCLVVLVIKKKKERREREGGRKKINRKSYWNSPSPFDIKRRIFQGFVHLSYILFFHPSPIVHSCPIGKWLISRRLFPPFLEILLSFLFSRREKIPVGKRSERANCEKGEGKRNGARILNIRSARVEIKGGKKIARAYSFRSTEQQWRRKKARAR